MTHPRDDLDSLIEEIKTLPFSESIPSPFGKSLIKIAQKINETVRAINKHHGKVLTQPTLIDIKADLKVNNKTNAFESEWLRYVFNPAIVITRPVNSWLALFTSDPGEAGAVAGEPLTANGYARVSCPFVDPVVGFTSNSIDLAFGPSSAAWGSITHVGVCKSGVRGTADLMYYGPLVTAANVNASGLSPRFVNGTLTVSEKNLFSGLSGIAQGNATVLGDGTVSGSSPSTYPDLDFIPPTGIAQDGTGTVMDTTFPVVTGASFVVTNDVQMLAALAAVQYGDEIVIQAGATISDFEVPTGKAGFVPGKWILVRSSRLNEISSDFYNIKPAKALAKLATINSPTVNTASIHFARNTNGWWFAGFEFTNSFVRNLDNALVDIFPYLGLAGDTNNHAKYIVLDRCYVPGNVNGRRRGFGFNGKFNAALHCHIEGMVDANLADSQGIAGWTGPGPYKIIGCAIEAATENILWGGAGPEIETEFPADIEVRETLMYKRDDWLNNQGLYNLKNLYEIKDGKRSLVQGCVMYGMRVDSQQSSVIHQSLNEGTAGHADFNFAQEAHYRYNKLFNMPGILAISSLSGPSAFPSTNGAQRIQFSHNAQMDQMNQPGSLTYLGLVGNNERAMPGIHITNNLTQCRGIWLYFSDTAFGHIKLDFKFNDNVNIDPALAYAFSGSEGPLNEVAFNAFCGAGNWQCRNNVAINTLLDQGTGELLTAPHNNHDVANVFALGLIGGSNYRFAASSPYIAVGTGGNPPGPDWDVLDTLTSWYRGLP